MPKTQSLSVNGSAPPDPASPCLVAVSDPLPAYRRGLADALREAGYGAKEVEDLVGWGPPAAPGGIIVTVNPVADDKTLPRLRETWPGAVIVAVLVESPPAAYALSIVLGASVAVGREESPQRIAEALGAALDRRTIMPTAVAASLARGTARMDRLPELSADQLSWLNSLAQGGSVTDLARSAGFSRRQMHRELQDLYTRLGAGGRAEALVAAARHGLL
jgi:DNA-binding NarL/FixJ family response regulator